MGKRAAVTAPKAKAAKVAKTAEVEDQPVIEKASPEDEIFAPVFSLISECEEALSMPNSVSAMLSAAVPFCLRAPAASRHEYQTKLVSTLQSSFDELQTFRQSEVAGEQAKVAELENEKSTIGTRVEEAKANLQAKQQNRDSKASAETDAETASKNATQAHEETLKEEADLDAKHKQNQEKKAAFEEVLKEVWTPLKNFEYVGKDWRLRDKQITRLMSSMEECSIDESLRDSLPVALRTKPEARGPFAAKVLEFGEAAISKHIEELASKIASFDSTVALCKEKVSSAEALVKSTADSLSKAQDELVTAENELAEAEANVKAQEEAAASLVPRTAAAAEELDAKEGERDATSKLIASFSSFKEEGAPKAE